MVKCVFLYVDDVDVQSNLGVAFIYDIVCKYSLKLLRTENGRPSKHLFRSNSLLFRGVRFIAYCNNILLFKCW